MTLWKVSQVVKEMKIAQASIYAALDAGELRGYYDYGPVRLDVDEVKKWAEKHGLGGQRLWKDKEKEKALKLKEMGLSNKQIAAQLGKSPEAVSQMLYRLKNE